MQYPQNTVILKSRGASTPSYCPAPAYPLNMMSQNIEREISKYQEKRKSDHAHSGASFFFGGEWRFVIHHVSKTTYLSPILSCLRGNIFPNNSY